MYLMLSQLAQLKICECRILYNSSPTDDYRSCAKMPNEWVWSLATPQNAKLVDEKLGLLKAIFWLSIFIGWWCRCGAAAACWRQTCWSPACPWLCLHICPASCTWPLQLVNCDSDVQCTSIQNISNYVKWYYKVL